MSVCEVTRRDRFAMAALTGFLANSEAAHAGAEPMTSYLSREENAAWVAQRAYVLADAMEAARKAAEQSQAANNRITDAYAEKRTDTAHQIEMAVARATLRSVVIPSAEACGKSCDCTADCERAYATHHLAPETVECDACQGAGVIVEPARTAGRNQHSACQMQCEDCEGSGRVGAAEQSQEEGGESR